MSLLEWSSLAALCLAGAASPGPSLAVVVNASVTGGRVAGFGAAWSHALGVGLYAALTIFGLSVLITSRPGVFLSLQIAGALYLLWIAVGLWRSDGESASDATSTAATRRAVRDGFAVAFLNPKLAVFMLALFSSFVRPGADNLVNGLLIGTATIIDGLWYSLVTLMITRPGWVEALRRHGALINRVFSVLLSVLAVTILLRLSL